MRKGRYQKKNTLPRKCYIFLLLLLLVLIILLALRLFPNPAPVTMPNGMEYENVEDVAKNQGTISIPGYEAITLQADKKQQTIGFKNPAENNCYFQISLRLEDGTLLWQSELIEPGAISDPVKLNNSLAKGTYPNALLQYACFTMDGSLSPLNGAEMKLTLWVK